MITVVNLHDARTRQIRTDDPCAAVVIAHEQTVALRTGRRFEGVLDPIGHPELRYGEFTIACGDWCAMKSEEVAA